MLDKEEVKKRFRLFIPENPEVPDVYLLIKEGLIESEAYEMLAMYRDAGKIDVQIEEYWPDAHRLGRDAELH
tara:strand:- start:80 stop:295 length:216 start_codon:yes stop_codon:yes gene_type:complete